MKLQPFTRKDLRRLIELEGGPHLSAFLPAPLRILDGEQDRIRIGNLVREARQTLREFWMPESDADTLLEPLRKFADDAVLAQPRTYSVAIFLCENFFQPFRIDTAIEYQWFIGRKFHVRSLLPEMERLESYYVLTLSEKKVALFKGLDGALEQQSVDGMQESFKEFEATFSADSGLQIHSSGVRSSGKQGAVFHGHGGIADSELADLENYLKHIDHAIHSFLTPFPPAPIILAGVDSLTSKYRHISHSETILPDCLSGNVDHLSANELHHRVCNIAAQEHFRLRNEQVIRIREHDVPVETNSELILAAAVEGRIETLFIDRDAELFGMFYADRGILKEIKHAPTGDPADASHDLIELAAAETLKRGGAVHAVQRTEMPFDRAMAAALRF
jgi:Bacterial archaeo-eukaryotic release factor family 7